MMFNRETRVTLKQNPTKYDTPFLGLYKKEINDFGSLNFGI